MQNHKAFAGVVQAKMSTFVDARGRTKQFLTARCPSPSCSGALIIALRGLEPAHLTQEEGLELVAMLRAGPKHPALKASPYKSGRYFFVRAIQGGRYVVAYDLEGFCDFLIAGGPIENVAGGMGAVLTEEQRLRIAGDVEKELAVNTGALNGAVASA